MASCEDCDLAWRVGNLEEDSKRNQKTHEGFFTRFEEMSNKFTRTDTQYGQILTSLSEVKTAVKDITDRPGKRWETVITAIITGVVSFVIAWALRGGV